MEKFTDIDHWQNIIFTRVSLEKLDHCLKNIKGQQELPYEGVSIVFSEDSHQLKSVGCESHGILYEGVMNGLFEASINIAILLEKSHWFDRDLVFGELIKCLWKGVLIGEDFELLNTRVVGKNEVTLPGNTNDADTWYVCPSYYIP